MTNNILSFCIVVCHYKCLLTFNNNNNIQISIPLWVVNSEVVFITSEALPFKLVPAPSRLRELWFFFVTIGRIRFLAGYRKRRLNQG